MYPELARVVDTPTRRKSKAPHPTHGRGPRPGAAAMGIIPGASQSSESEEGESDADADARESLECSVPTVEPSHAVPDAAEPLLLHYPAPKSAPGAVAVAAVV